MKLKEGSSVAYQKRHEQIWPEIKELLKENGVEEYSIFIDRETDTLFGFQKVSREVGSQDLGHHPIIKKWWEYMSDIMEINADNSPASVELDEIFYLE